MQNSFGPRVQISLYFYSILFSSVIFSLVYIYILSYFFLMCDRVSSSYFALLFRLPVIRRRTSLSCGGPQIYRKASRNFYIINSQISNLTFFEIYIYMCIIPKVINNKNMNIHNNLKHNSHGALNHRLLSYILLQLMISIINIYINI